MMPNPALTGSLPDRQSGVNVAMATLAATVSFGAWALLSPLGPDLRDRWLLTVALDLYLSAEGRRVWRLAGCPASSSPGACC